MKKFILLLIPILLMTVIIYGIIKLVILPDLGKGALQVTAKPKSEVYLNGKSYGATPLCLCEGSKMIKSGDYVLKLIAKDGSKLEFQEKVTINKGVLTVVDRKLDKGATSEGSTITLQPLADKKSSELLVISLPDKADVFLDSNFIGKTSFHMAPVTDSDHTLRIKKEGYKDKNIRIRTPLGFKLVAIVYLSLQLDQQPASASAEPSASSTPSALPKATPMPSAKKIRVTILPTPNGFLRVRQEPSLTGAEITRVNSGDTYDVLQSSNGWYQIQLPDETSGWVSGDYVQEQ